VWIGRTFSLLTRVCARTLCLLPLPLPTPSAPRTAPGVRLAYWVALPATGALCLPLGACRSPCRLFHFLTASALPRARVRTLPAKHTTCPYAHFKPPTYPRLPAVPYRMHFGLPVQFAFPTGLYAACNRACMPNAGLHAASIHGDNINVTSSLPPFNAILPPL